MNDICYCTGMDCEIREECKRYRIKQEERIAWWIRPEYDYQKKQCENFIELCKK